MRQSLAKNPKNFDPRKFLTASIDAMRDICRLRYEAFGSAGQASKIKAIPLDTMFRRYSKGELDPRVTGV